MDRNFFRFVVCILGLAVSSFPLIVAFLLPGLERRIHVSPEWLNVICLAFVLIGMLLFFHALLWRRLVDHDPRWVKPIDLIWYSGSIIAIILAVMEFSRFYNSIELENFEIRAHQIEQQLVISVNDARSSYERRFDEIFSPLYKVCRIVLANPKNIKIENFCINMNKNIEIKMDTLCQKKIPNGDDLHDWQILESFYLPRKYFRSGSNEPIVLGRERHWPVQVLGNVSVERVGLCGTWTRSLYSTPNIAVLRDLIRIEREEIGQRFGLLWAASGYRLSRSPFPSRFIPEKGWWITTPVEVEWSWFVEGKLDNRLEYWTRRLRGESTLDMKEAFSVYFFNDGPQFSREFRKNTELLQDWQFYDLELSEIRSVLPAFGDAKSINSKVKWYRGVWPYIIAVIIALRLCKTTAEVIDAWRKKTR